VEDRHGLVVKSIPDAVGTAAGRPLARIRVQQRFPYDLRLYPQVTLDEFPSRRGDGLGQFLGELPVLVENAAIRFDLGDRDVDDRRSCLFV